MIKRSLLALGFGCSMMSTASAVDGSLNCRSQTVFRCDPTCEVENQPADLSLNFREETGSWCRGERCTEGSLEAMSSGGQWDDREYTLFKLTGTDADKFVVQGLVFPDGTFFTAMSDELGNLAGSCEPMR